MYVLLRNDKVAVFEENLKKKLANLKMKKKNKKSLKCLTIVENWEKRTS